MRVVAAVVTLGLLVTGLSVVPSAPAEAAVVQWGTNAGTSPNYQNTVNGDFLMAGNGVLACLGAYFGGIGSCTDLHSASGGNANTANDNFYLQNSNTVAGFTTNSSSATITIPAGASVVKAFLSWSANTGTFTGTTQNVCTVPDSGRGTAAMPAGSATGYRTQPAKIKVGAGAVTSVAPASVLEDPAGTASALYYSASADVTSAFTGALSGTPLTVSAGDIWTPEGAGCYAGWSLTVVYDYGLYIPTNPLSTPHRIIFYEGHVRMTAAEAPLTVAFNGFSAVASGTRAGYTLFEGDRVIQGDKAEYSRGGGGFSQIPNSAGNTNNIGIGRGEGSVRYTAFTDVGPFTNQSVDVATADLPNVQAGDSSVNLRMSTSGDSYLLRNVILSVPSAGINISKTYDGTLDQQSRTATETATFTVTITNSGVGVLQNIVVSDDQTNCARALTGVTLAPLQSYTYTCTANGVTTASYDSTASVTASTVVGANVATGSDSTRVLLSSLSLAKASALAGGATGRAGDTLNYTFTVKNNGDSPLTGVAVTDPLPGLSAITYTWPTGTAGALAAGASATGTATYTLTQADVDAGSIANTATTTGTDADGGVKPVATANRTTPIPVNAVLTTTKSASYAGAGVGNVGDTVNYSFSVKNTGNVTLTSVTLTDPLTGLSAIAVTWPGTAGRLAPGQTATGTATYTVKQADVNAGKVVNQATSTGRTPKNVAVTGLSNEVTLATAPAAPGLTTTKSGTVDNPKGVGSVVTYNFSAKNTGNVTLTGVTIADPLVGLSALTYSWPGTAGTLAPGQTVTATATYTVKQSDVDAGLVRNTATSSGTSPSGTAITAASPRVDVPLQTRAPAVSLTKSGALAGGSTAGSTVNYSFVLTNSGNVTLTNAGITDPLSGLSAITYGTWPGTVGTLAPGQSVTATATYTVKQSDVDAGAVVNSATAKGTPPTGADVTRTTPATVPITADAKMIVTKSGAYTTGSGAVGSVVTYTFSVKNDGNVTLSQVVLADPLSGLSPISVTWPGASGVLAPGQTATGTATYTVKQSDVDAGSVKNTATATAKTPTGATVTQPSTQSVVPTVTPTRLITTTKSATIAGGATGKVGDVINYSFSAKNDGNVTLSGVTIADPHTGLSALTYTWPGATGVLAPGQTVTAVATYTIKQSDVDAGSVKNIATGSGTHAGTTVSNPSSEITVPTVAANPVVTTLKSGALAAGSTGRAGDTVNFSIKLTNSGNVTLTSVSVTDTLPGLSALTYGTWPSGTAGTLAPGQSVTATATYALKQSDVDAGSVSNTATGSGTPPTGAAVTSVSPATVPITAGPALTVSKSGAVTTGNGSVGDTITFSFVVRNTGNVTATSVGITDTLPDLSAVTFGTWPSGTAGTLAPNTQVTATATYTIKQADVNAGSVKNTATASGTIPGGGTVSATSPQAVVPTVASAPAIDTQKSASVAGTGAVGDVITYTFVAKNTGNVTLTGVSIADPLTGLSALTYGTWPGGVAGTLAPNAQVTATATYTIVQSDVDAGSVKNTATSTGNFGGTAVTDPSPQVTTPTVAAVRTISLAKNGVLAAGATGVAGDTVNYSFVVRNTGNVTLTGVGATDPLPGLSAVTFGAWPSGTAGRLLPNAQVTATATYVLKQSDVDAGSVANTATTRGTPPTGAAVSATAPATVPVAANGALAVAKTGAVTSGTGGVGSTMTFSFSITNPGNVTMTGVAIADSLVGLAAPVYTWPTATAGRIAPGETATATATYTVKQADVNAGSVSNTATVSGKTPTNATVTSAPSTANVPTIAGAPELTTTKSANVTSGAKVGDSITYSIAISNTGNQTITGVTLTDSLVGLSTPVVTWPGVAGTLAPGQTATALASYTVKQSDVDAGSIANTASAAGTAPGATPVSDDSNPVVTTTATPAPTLSLVKSGTLPAGSTSVAGEVVTYSFVIRNTGNVTLTGAAVTDPLSGLSAITYGTWPSGTTGTLAPNTQVTATATYTVKQSDVDAGSIANTATATGTGVIGGAAAPKTSSATVPLASTAKLTVSKTGAVAAGANKVGDTVTFSFVVKNTGNVTLSSVGITDSLADLSAVTFGTWPGGTTGVLAPNAQVTATATYTIKQSDVNAGSVKNTATASGTPPSGPVATATSPEAVVPTVAASPALVTTKSAVVGGTGTGALGDTITYTFTAKNTGNVTLTGVTLTDPLPGLSTPTYVWSGGVSGQLNPNGTVTGTATYTITQADVDAGSVKNIATATGTPPTGAAVTAPSPQLVTPTIASAPKIGVTKSGALAPGAQGVAGDVVTWSLTLTNSGNVTLTSVSVTDSLPGISAVTYGTWPSTAGTLAPGQSVSATATYVLTQADIDAGAVSNTANGSGTPPRGSPATATAPATLPLASNSTITLDKTAAIVSPGTGVVGDTIRYTFTAQNTGNVTLTNVIIADPRPGLSALTYGTWPSGTVGRLAPGQSITATADYVIRQADQNAGVVNNTASVSGKPPAGPNTTASSAAVATPTATRVPGILTTKTSSVAGTGAVGDVITYTITVRNTGNTTLTSVSASDPLSGLSTLTYGAWPGGVTGTLQPNTQVVATAKYTIKQSDVNAGSVTNTATGQGTSPSAGVITDPSDEVVTPTVAANPVATFSKTGALAPGSVGAAGDTITYTFTTKNTGNVTLTGVAVSDPLADLGAITYTWPGATGVLTPGQTVTATANYTVKQSDVDAGSVSNTATVTATPPSGTPFTESDSETVSIAADPRIEVEKTSSVIGDGVLGDTIVFTMTMRNTGNQTLTVVTLIDSLPGLGTPTFDWPGADNELAPGETAVATASYVIDQDDINLGTVTNTATVSAQPPGGAPEVNATSGPVTVATGLQRPELTTTKTASTVPSPAAEGTQITYSFSVENTGNVTVDNLVLNDPLLGASTPILSPTTLLPGEIATATANYTITQADVDAGSVTNTVKSQGTLLGAVPIESPVASVTTATEPSAPGISVTKTGTAAQDAGDLIDWSFTVTNTGNVTLSGVTLNDALAGVTPVFGAFPSGISGQLNPGDSVLATADDYVVTQADVDSGSVVNTVTASGTPSRGAVAKASTAATVPLTPDAGITIVKAEDATPAARGLGDPVNFTFTVTNTGNVTLSSISIIDELDGVSAISYDDWDGNPAGSLGPNDVLTATATYSLTQADVDRGFVDNDSSVLASTPAGATLTENSTTVRVSTEAASPVLVTTKDAVLNGAGNVGDTISYTVTLLNNGNVTVTDATITDSLAGLSALVYGEWLSGVDGELAPGESVSATANYTITQADVDAGSVSNVATGDAVSARDGAAVTDDSPAAVTPLVTQVAALSATKTGALESGAEGEADDIVEFSFTITNDGNVTLTGVTLVDPLADLSVITYTWPTATDGVLAPGATATAVATYQLKQSDVDSGSVVNLATPSGVDPNAVDVTGAQVAATVVVEPDASLSAVKTGELRAGGIGQVGEIIDYTLVATNTGNVTLHDGELLDPLPGITPPVITWPNPAEPGVLKVGESVTGTASYALTQEDVDRGFRDNTARVQALTPNNAVVPATTNTVVIPTVRPAPLLTVDKSAVVANGGELGDEIAYSFTISNDGNITIDGITLSDPLPGLTGLTVNWPVGNTSQTLAPGESVGATATYEITQNDVNAGEVRNTATASGTGAQSTPVSGSSPEIVTEIVEAAPSLSATKSAALAPGATGVAGDTVEFSFTVANDGNVSLTSVDLIDQLPGLTGVTFGAWPTATDGLLNPGDDIAATATYTLLQSDIDAGSLANRVSATGTPPAGSAVTEAASATLPLTPAPNFTVTKAGDLGTQTGEVGDVIDYTFSITNSGNVTLSGVVLIDSLAGVSAPVVAWPGADRVLAPGETATATANYTITQSDVDAGSVSNTAQALGSTPDGSEYSEFSDPAVNPTIARTATVTIEKVGSTPDGAALGDLVQYDFTLQNTGNTTLTGVAIDDPLVGLSTIVYSWPGAAGELAPNETATATATYAITQADIDLGYVRNSADVDATSPLGAVDDSVGPIDVPTVTAAPAIETTKNGALEAGATGFAGDTVEYSFTVRNSGNVTLTAVELSDPLTGLSALTYTWPTATDGTLAPGQSATAVATYELTQADVDAGKVDNEVTAEGTTPTAGTVDNTATETVTITPAPVLTPFKEGVILNGGVGAVGDTIEYTLTVTNDGNVTLYDGQLLDPLPGLSVPVITWPDPAKPGEIPVGQSVVGVATYELTQEDVDRGFISNIADMSAETPAGVLVVETSNEVIVPTVLPAPNITVTKAGAPQGTADLGDTIDYSFEILNSGNVTLDSVTLTDPLPNLSAITITWPTPASPGVLAPGEIALATADYEITQDDVDAGAVLNIATADGVDPNGTDVTDDSEANTVPTETIRAVVELTKSGALADPARADEGDTVNWSFELSNTGNVTLTGVEIVDSLAGISALTYTWPGVDGTLEVGESVIATATSTLTQAQIDMGTVVNDAVGSGTPPRGDAVSDAATAAVVLASQASMAVTKTGAVDGLGEEGDTIDYEFGITNTGNVTLTLVDLVDALVGVSSPVFTWPGPEGELQPGETVTATANYTITQGDVDLGTVTNVATASGKPPIGDTITVSTSVTETTVATADPELTLTKSSTTGASAGVNDIITYTFEVENTGNVTVDGIIINDPLPGLSTPVVNWPGANGVLAPRETATAIATYAITQADVDAGKVDNTAIANGTSPTDVAVASNTAVESTPTDVAAADILVTKTGVLAPGSTGFEGDLVEYEFSLTNNGNQTLTAVSLADPLPGLSSLVYSWPTATVGTLTPGAVVTATATYELTQVDIDSGSVANVVTGSATPPSGTAFTENAPAAVAIAANGELEALKSGQLRAGGIGQVGDWVDFRLEVLNTGNVTLHDGELRDPLPGLSVPVITWPNPAQPGVVRPGEMVIGEASVQLTQEDVDRGHIANIADVGGTEPNGDDVEATSNEVIVATVQPQPSMTVVKSGDVALTGENGLGDTVDFEFEIRNTGNVTIGSIVVTDPLPGMTTPDVQWPTAVETLAPNETVTATASYDIRQSDVDRGYVENTASATAVPVRGDPISAVSNTTQVPTEAPSVVVSVTNVGALTDPGPAEAGDTVTWNYSFTSTSNVTLSGVELSDFLGSLPAGDYTWPNPAAQGVLAPGDTVTAVRVQTLTQADIDSGAVSSVVTGEGTPPVGAAATATAPATVTLAADGLLQVTKSSELAVAGENGPGDTIDYTIVVTNIGNVTLRTVTITDSIDNVSINSIAWPANSGVLAPGQSATASATYVLEQDDVDRGYVDNTASVRGVTPGGDPVTATSNVDRELTAVADPSITAEKSGVMTSGSGEVGSEITYSFIVKNTGNVTLRLVGVIDPLIDVVPSDLTFPSATGILGPNEQAVGSVVYTVTQADVDNGTVENTATAVGTAPDGTEVRGVSNTVLNPTEDAEPSIVTSHTAALAAGATGVLGDGMDYTFTITNDGNVTLDGVTLSNTIPGLTGFVYTWPVPAAPGVLAPGESVTVTATRLVDQADVDAGEVRNVATGAGNSPGAVAVDADSAVTVVPLVLAVSSVEIVKAGEPRDALDPVVVGSWIDYEFTVQNTGETTLSGVTAVDPKVGTTAVVYGAWPAATGVLAPGESVTATASYQVTQAEFDAGSASNTANVASTNPAGDDIVDTSNTVLVPTAAGTPDIGITKTQVLAAGATGNAGDTVEYSFEVTNTGDVTLNGVTIADDQIDLSTLTITWPGAPGVLAPGQSATATATYVLTQDDVDAGSISSDASTAGTPVVGAVVTDTATGSTPIVENPSMTITKTSSFATFAQQGATVNYVIEVVNTGNVTLTGVVITDPKPGVSALTYNWPGTPGELAPGESVAATATYVITQRDVDVEQTTNVATVDANSPSGAITPESATNVLPIPNVPAIALTISGALAAGQQGFPGDVVTFTYVATNTGTLPLTNVSIADPRSGLSAMRYGTWPGAIGQLAPGESITATATYVIRESDAGTTLFETATVTSTEINSGDPVVATAQTTLQLPTKALSYTGSDPRGTLATGLGTLLAGLALILLGRRRQRQEES